MNQRVTIQDAAKEIGCNQEFLRQQMKKGEWDLGMYVKHRRGKRASYFIFRQKLDKFLGIEDDSEENNVGKECVKK